MCVPGCWVSAACMCASLLYIYTRVMECHLYSLVSAAHKHSRAWIRLMGSIMAVVTTCCKHDARFQPISVCTSVVLSQGCCSVLQLAACVQSHWLITTSMPRLCSAIITWTEGRTSAAHPHTVHLLRCDGAASAASAASVGGAERCRQWTVPVNQLETCAMRALSYHRQPNHLDLVETLASLNFSVL